MAGFATRPSFAGHTGGGGAKTNHELTSAPDHQMGAGHDQKSRFALHKLANASLPHQLVDHQDRQSAKMSTIKFTKGQMRFRVIDRHDTDAQIWLNH
jgi:hypothetical protein